MILSPANKANLLVWRTESIFFTQEKRKLSREWNKVRFTSLPYPDEPDLTNSSLEGKLRFSDNTFDAIYCFHVFEHLSWEEGLRCLKEMHRILKPGGVCRISTPNLEFFAEEYLKEVRATAEYGGDSSFRYQWSMLNLIDQAVRKKSGGGMATLLSGNTIDQEYLKHLNGDSLNFVVDPNNGQSFDSVHKPTYFDGSPAPLSFQIKKKAYALLRKVILKTSPMLDVEIMNERNRWLYDQVSLAQLYRLADFSEVFRQEYNKSLIEDWFRYNYDASIYGDYPLEPSLFMEGRK
jgi:predicted SAM-dependent methyltransferase